MKFYMIEKSGKISRKIVLLCKKLIITYSDYHSEN